MPGLLSAPRITAPALLDVLNPVDWSAPLNRGLLNWHLALPHQMGGTTWRNLVRPVHATLTGTEPRSATAGWNATRRQGGLGEVRLNGVDGSGGTLASSTAYDFLNTSFTVSCWMRANVAAQATLVARRHLSIAEASWFFRVDAGGTLTARITDALGTGTIAQRTSVGTTLVNGQWHHLLVVFTTNTGGAVNNDVTLYVNGRLDQGARTSSGTGYGAPTQPVTFGSTATLAAPLNGALDDVRIATRGLAAQEVRALYQASRTGYRRELRWLAPPLLVVVSAGTVRSLAVAVVGASTTPASSAMLLHRLQATLSALSVTPASLGHLTRRLTSTLVGSSSTPSSSAVLGRRLQASVAGQTTTAPLTIQQTHRVTASVATISLTPVISPVVQHRLASMLMASSTTPAISVRLVHRLPAQLSGTSQTPAASVVLTHRLAAVLTASSSTPTVQARHSRAVQTTLAATSTTSAATVHLPGQVILSTHLTAQSSTSVLALPPLRHALTAHPLGLSVTPPSQGQVHRRLATALTATSLTPAATVVLTQAVTFTAALQGSSATPAITATLAHTLQTMLTATSTTPGSAITVERHLAGLLAGVSLTPAAVVLPASGMVTVLASLVGTSQTPAILLFMAPTVRVGVIPPGDRTGHTGPGARIGTVPAGHARVGIVAAEQ